ncbi:GNAT family N-acetyltransferase [Saccharibacillus kuerlensis]|uniref:N-acetyltransferase YobR n=1 Tax=Saccharibacillus kuerlensis TaxID=459527 RepID=A0ABQ2KRT3_9BACL|nr:GNAT family N-acetyltransferase [Saccharibacillus kuerlensis]GGN90793.1 putative N-acetyltransferase YobR [Saccharibacillus kuerlensis]
MTKVEQNGPHLEQAQSLERLAIEAWPPRVRQPLGGWLMRASNGISKRANSIWTGAPYPDVEGGWLSHAEDFAERHGIAPCFYVSDTSPEDLDAVLEKARYTFRDACFLMNGSAALIRKLSSGRLIEGEQPETAWQQQVEVGTRSANPDWLEDFLELEGFPLEKGPGYAAIFNAAGPEKTFVRLRIAGETAAIGASVLQDGCAYVSSIAVASKFRRRGLAFRLMAELSGWAVEHGARDMYLQVLQDNLPAVRLYEALEFKILAQHHYRILND